MKNQKGILRVVVFSYIWYIYIYKYMWINVGMELPAWEGNRHIFSWSVCTFLLEQYECQNNVTNKKLKSPFSLTH